MQLQSGPSEPPNHQIKLEESTKSFKARKERLDKLKERLKIPSGQRPQGWELFIGGKNQMFRTLPQVRSNILYSRIERLFDHIKLDASSRCLS